MQSKPLSTGNLPPDDDIEDLWERMAKIYGHKWTSSYGDADDGTWRAGLRGLTRKHIAHGLTKCVRGAEVWPPSLPEFIAMCKPTPQDFGLPNFETAYREAIRGCAVDDHVWTHPAVYHAMQEVGRYEFKNFTDSRLRQLFERAYEITCRRVMDGEQLDAPIPKALPEKISVTTPEAAARGVAALRGVLSK